VNPIEQSAFDVQLVGPPELHEGSQTRKRITWHDLRVTGATWMAVRGNGPLKIKQRCGHPTFSATEIDIRQREAMREGFGEPRRCRSASFSPPAFRTHFATKQNRPPQAIGNPLAFRRRGRDSSPGACPPASPSRKNASPLRED
jgi:hypothetical protein